MRLNAFLARAGKASRRGADDIIKAGRVMVNGKIGELNTKVENGDIVQLDGKDISIQKLRYILFYKPTNTVTTLKDPQDRPTILDDVKIPERVIPVGRLDFDTTGALLLTNDGDLAHKLMHPSFEVDKVYEAEVDVIVSPRILDLLSNPIMLDDGLTAPAQARELKDKKIELTIHEGKNHQVKRMLAAVGLNVIKLHRSQYGPLDLRGLKPSQWRELTDEEVLKLKK